MEFTNEQLVELIKHYVDVANICQDKEKLDAVLKLLLDGSLQYRK